MTINFAISRGDFAIARKMIDLLPDEKQKAQLLETVNRLEAISLARQGDALAAGKLAEQLNSALSILEVYPVLIDKCVVKKDTPCVNNLFYQAIKQL